MANQNQRTEGGSVGIQSGRDTVITQGVSPEDMRQIITTLANQIPAYAAIAAKIVEERLKDFEQRVMNRFADQSTTRSEAFKDPDFQYLINRSQHAYARSGDAVVRDTLIDLIARRSQETDRSRLSLSLNEAVEKAPFLTRNEFAELSLCYLLRYTRNYSVNSRESFCQYLRSGIVPFLSDISLEHSSYSYLEAQSCAAIGITQLPLLGLFRALYGGVFSKGFERPALESHLPDGKKDLIDRAGLVIACLNDPSRLQLNTINKDSFLERGAASGLSEPELNNVYSLFESTFWTQDELVAAVQTEVPEIARLFELWDGSDLKRLILTSIGIAIGHANAVRVCKLDADLRIWIK